MIEFTFGLWLAMRKRVSVIDIIPQNRRACNHDPCYWLACKSLYREGDPARRQRQFQKEEMDLTSGCALEPDEGRLLHPSLRIQLLPVSPSAQNDAYGRGRQRFLVLWHSVIDEGHMHIAPKYL